MYKNIHYRLGLHIQNDSLHQLGVAICHVFVILPINHSSNNVLLLAGSPASPFECFSFLTIPTCSWTRGYQSLFQDNCKFTLVVYLRFLIPMCCHYWRMVLLCSIDILYLVVISSLNAYAASLHTWVRYIDCLVKILSSGSGELDLNFAFAWF